MLHAASTACFQNSAAYEWEQGLGTCNTTDLKDFFPNVACFDDPAVSVVRIEQGNNVLAMAHVSCCTAHVTCMA